MTEWVDKLLFVFQRGWGNTTVVGIILDCETINGCFQFMWFSANKENSSAWNHWPEQKDQV